MIATVFDTETTGLIINPARKLDTQPEIISLAIQDVDLAAGEITNQYYQEFKPLKPISEEITRITRITNEQLKDAHSMNFELPNIIPRFSGAPIILGQNIRFDMDMVELECKRYNYPVPKWPMAIDLIQHTIHLKGFRLSLTNLHKELFGTEFASAHNAGVDCTTTSKCAIELFKRGLL
jgi:DNA polymerase III epsilon subunit-like protein